MDSSFLTVIHVGLGLFSLVNVMRLLIQFGLPNHPLKFLSYIVSLSVVSYWCGHALTDLGVFSPWAWMHWRTLPLVLGSLTLLFQVLTMIARIGPIQQKVISRLPVIGAILCFALFQQQAHYFAATFIILGALFFIISVGKARYQKRQYLKMAFFLGVAALLRYFGFYWAHIVAEILMFFSLFYFFVFQQSADVTAMVDRFREESEGEPA